MYTRRNRCLPTFHSTSTISRPSERATRSAAPRIFSKSTQRLPDLSRSAVHSNRPNKKVGSRPLIRSTTSERNQSIFPLHCKCKIRASGSAISEQLRMPEKEAGIWAGFLAPWPVATGGVYFQTGLLRIVCRLMEFLRCALVVCRKRGHPAFFLLCINCCWQHTAAKDCATTAAAAGRCCAPGVCHG